MALAALTLLAGTAAGLAQDAAPEDAPQPARAAPAAAPAPTPDQGDDRVARIEQQISDLQAMVAALVSLVKSKPEATLPQESAAAGAPAGAADPSLSARVDALETRLGALTGQIEVLTQQLGTLDSRGAGGGEAPPGAAEPPPPPADEAPMPMEPPGRQGQAPADPETRFGSADAPLVAESGDPAKLLPPSAGGDTASADGTGERQASLAPGADAATLYNQGYDDLLRRDYGAAEGAFQALVANFPNDTLAGKAQYWLGETYFVRGQFKDAADAFLKSYKGYKAGEKAPDSLVKLGLALGELGQKDAACATLGEFKKSYPTADAVLRDQARSERVRLGC